MSNYEWRFCKQCHERIFKDEIEGETIQTVNGDLYCIDCAEDKSTNKDVSYGMGFKSFLFNKEE